MVCQIVHRALLKPSEVYKYSRIKRDDPVILPHQVAKSLSGPPHAAHNSLLQTFCITRFGAIGTKQISSRIRECKLHARITGLSDMLKDSGAT